MCWVCWWGLWRVFLFSNGLYLNVKFFFVSVRVRFRFSILKVIKIKRVFRIRERLR